MKHYLLSNFQKISDKKILLDFMSGFQLKYQKYNYKWNHLHSLEDLKFEKLPTYSYSWEQKMEWRIVHIHFSKMQIFHSIVCILLTIASFWMHKNHISTKAHMELALKFVYKTRLLLQKSPKTISFIHSCMLYQVQAKSSFSKIKPMYLQNLGNCVLNQNPH